MNHMKRDKQNYKDNDQGLFNAGSLLPAQKRVISVMRMQSKNSSPSLGGNWQV